MRYYFLIGYLPELHRDDRKIIYSLNDLLGERYHLPDNDFKEIELLLLGRDFFIIEKLLSGKPVQIEHSLYGVEFWQDEIQSPKESPEFIADFLIQQDRGTFGPREIDALNNAYYNYVWQHSNNRMFKGFLAFEHDLRNLTAAIRARKKNMNIADHLVGESQINELIVRSNAEDFGLSSEYPWVEGLLATDSPLQYQELIEQILWDYLDDHAGNDPFHFNFILSYLIKIQMIEKKLELSEEEGMVKVLRLEGR